MKISPPTLARSLLGAAGLLALSGAAQAGLCAISDSGAPVKTVNPKPFIEPPPATCRVNGLPGSASLPGYILVASRVADLTVNSVKVGSFYDRVYCLGTGTTCDATRTYILASRVQMASTPVNFPVRNPNCPLWSGVSNECFEINNLFRNIRGTAAAPVAASVGYWMGKNATSTNPDTALSQKYLEYTGKTYKGLNQLTPPGTAADRDNTRVMFWADVNVFDPDGENSRWSPWLYVRQNCPNGVVTANLTTDPRTRFAVKFWQGGEEGQIQTNVQAAAYVCVP